jgi:D-sedoheptulose 7-phosphate isomerase
MMASPREWFVESIAILQRTAESAAMEAVHAAAGACSRALANGLPLLVCGNGGSAADAQHITCELVGRFLKERRGQNVICLADNAATLTAWANDYSYDDVFARQVEAYGRPGGVLIGLSTSGNSANVVRAFERARAEGLVTVAFTGEGGGKLAALADHLITVPSRVTPLVQQAHLCLYHWLCAAIEAEMAGAA